MVRPDAYVEMDAAEVALASGAGMRAVELARHALATLETATPNKANAGSGGADARARALNATGRYHEALPAAEKRVAAARALLGGYRFSYRLGKALLEAASARAGIGDRVAARDAVAAAIEHLEATAGPESRALRPALELKGQLDGQ